eukprot:scpid69727/ scgid23535/ 
MSNSPVSSFRGSPSGLPVHKLVMSRDNNSLTAGTEQDELQLRTALPVHELVLPRTLTAESARDWPQATVTLCCGISSCEVGTATVPTFSTNSYHCSRDGTAAPHLPSARRCNEEAKSVCFRRRVASIVSTCLVLLNVLTWLLQPSIRIALASLTCCSDACWQCCSVYVPLLSSLAASKVKALSVRHRRRLDRIKTLQACALIRLLKFLFHSGMLLPLVFAILTGIVPTRIQTAVFQHDDLQSAWKFQPIDGPYSAHAWPKLPVTINAYVAPLCCLHRPTLHLPTYVHPRFTA